MTTNKSEIPIELENCVIGIIDASRATAAKSALRATGAEVTMLMGEEGRRHLQHEGAAGWLERAVAFFGDELRIIDSIDDALAAGDRALIVYVEPDEAAATAALLKRRGAKAVWDFRDWTFTDVTHRELDDEGSSPPSDPR